MLRFALAPLFGLVATTWAIAAAAAESERIAVDRCEATDAWKVAGELLKLSARSEYKQEGERCLYVSYDGVGSASITVDVPEANLTEAHALQFKLRGPSPTANATLQVQLIAGNGGYFQKELGIANFEWFDVILLPADFPNAATKVPSAHGEAPTWADIRSITFKVENAAAGEQGNILLDDIHFRRIAVGRDGVRQTPDARLWWWDGGVDRFLAMHVRDADWPHLQSQPQHDAPLKFSHLVLAPLMSYRVFLHGDEQQTFDRVRLTITDWELKPIQTIERPARTGVDEIELRAPAKTGTYLFNLERFKPGSDTPEKYQTGVMVLAKRLSEPSGLWGLHSELTSTREVDHYKDVVLDMFQAVGVTHLREGLGMPGGASVDEVRARGARHAGYFREARSRGMKITGTMHVGDHREVYLSIAHNRFAPPEAVERFVKDVEIIAGAWKGLIDWYELGNEMNERDLLPYARGSQEIVHRS